MQIIHDWGWGCQCRGVSRIYRRAAHLELAASKGAELGALSSSGLDVLRHESTTNDVLLDEILAVFGAARRSV